MKQFTLSVVIPSYNEMANLQKGVLNKVDDYVKKQNYRSEIIIVDDGSDDGSCEFVKQFTKEAKNFKLIENNHTGKAGAVTTGMLEASGDYILFADMDQATPIEEVEKLLLHIESYKVIIGSRNDTRPGAPFSRKVMAKGMIFLRSSLIGLSEIKDTQCGFKLFEREAARKIFSKIKIIHKGFNGISGSSVTAGFDIELLYIAKKMRYSIREVPINWLYVETRRVSPLRDPIEGLFALFEIKRNIQKGVYN